MKRVKPHGGSEARPARLGFPTASPVAVILAALLTVSLALGDEVSPPLAGGPTAAAQASGSRPRFRADRFAGRAGTYYRLVWGVEGLKVKWTESGEVIRFSWQVLNVGKASQLSEQRTEPALIDPQAGVSLVVPAMDNIGKLRQTGSPEAGKSYWVAFSNKGRLVKRGDRVDVVIGQFRANGLVVD